jgi:phosphoglycolate phosphatase-like HAD superfamily hydrolase
MILFLFDIDGTLIHSGGAGIAALEDAFQEVLRLPRAMAGVICDGMTDPAIVRGVLAPHRLDSELNIRKVLQRYTQSLARRVRESTRFRILPRVVEALDFLSRRPDLRLGLATGNLEAGAWTKLKLAGLDRFFDFGGFGSDAEERSELVRRAIERGRQRSGDPRAAAVVIGDTPRDIQAAHQAGARALGVASGRYDVTALSAAGADWTLPDLAAPEVWTERVIAALTSSSP